MKWFENGLVPLLLVVLLLALYPLWTRRYGARAAWVLVARRLVVAASAGGVLVLVALVSDR